MEIKKNIIFAAVRSFNFNKQIIFEHKIGDVILITKKYYTLPNIVNPVVIGLSSVT